MANVSAIAILDRVSAKDGFPCDGYRVAWLTQNFEVAVDMLNEAGVVTKVSSGKIKPINFSIVNGKVVDDAGKFERLHEQKGVSPRIVVAEIVTESKRLLGYILLNKAGGIERVKRADLLAICEKAKQYGVPYLQNAIYKEVDNKKGVISSYPNKPFERIINRANPASKKPISHVDKERNKANLQGAAKYTPEQERELQLAEQNGVNKIFIANPKLTPKQMRILWVAKKNKMASECFANPKFSEDAMKFFADRLVSKEMFSECKVLFNPAYNVEQLTQIYLGIYNGVDVSKYADVSLSGEDMYFKRVEMESEYYKAPELDFGEVPKDANLNDCVNSFLSRKGKK